MHVKCVLSHRMCSFQVLVSKGKVAVGGLFSFLFCFVLFYFLFFQVLVSKGKVAVGISLQASTDRIGKSSLNPKT